MVRSFTYLLGYVIFAVFLGYLTFTVRKLMEKGATGQWTKENGKWKKVKICDMADARREAWKGKLQQLTFRQREVLQLLAEEKNTKEIAAIMEISVKTVEAHRANMMKKLRVSNAAQLLKAAIEEGFIRFRRA